MLELIDDQPIKAQYKTLVSSEKTNASLELVVSNPNPSQEPSSSQTTSNSQIKPSFMAEVQLRGPNLYSLLARDPSHYLECELILETEERDLDSLEPGAVICHFPNISDEKLQDHIWLDDTLYGIIMIQFQIKLLEQLLLFCATHYASKLIIFADDVQADALGVYQNFLTYKDQTLTYKGEKTEMVIPGDQATFDAWVDFMEKITIDFRQTLWREQRSNPFIRQYLKNHPLV